MIVCDSAGILAGVVTKTDVVSQICHCHGAGCITAASLAMTRDVAFCRPKGLAARCLGTHEGAEPKKYSCRAIRIPAPWDFWTHETFCKFFSKTPKTRNQCCEIM